MIAWLAGLAAASSLASTPNLILTSNSDETRWCAFDSVAAASARADEDNAMTVANAWTAGGKVVDLKILWGTSSGDWAVTDSYALDGWTTVSVDRDVGYAGTDQRLRQTFTRRGDRLVVSRSSDIDQFHPTEAPFADLRKAPFYDLLVRALAAGDLPDVGLCVRAPRQRRR
jgi:hypothetical protein